MTRKIDKRACRKFAIPELEFNLNEGILHVERCPYIIRTAVHNISGQRILVLYIYQSENILAGSIKPRWVMFHFHLERMRRPHGNAQHWIPWTE